MIPAITLYSVANFLKRMEVTRIRKIRAVEGGYYQVLLHSTQGNLSIFYNYSLEVLLPTLIRLNTSEKQPRWIKEAKELLENSIIEKIDTPNFERIIRFTCRKYDGRYMFYVEIFGGGNSIITNGENRIIALDKEIKVRHRELKRDGIYTLPPSKGFNPLLLLKCDYKEIMNKISKERDYYRVLNLDKYTVREALSRIDPEVDGEKRKREFLTKVLELIKIAEKGEEGYSIIEEENKIILLPYQPKHKKPVASYNNIFEASEEYLKRRLNEKLNREITKKRRKLLEEIEKLKKNKNQLEYEIKVLDEMLPTLYQKIDELTEVFQRCKEGKETGLQVDYARKVVHYPLNDHVTISLRFDMNPFQAIGLVYDKEYKRRKKGLEKIEEKLKEIQMKIVELDKDIREAPSLEMKKIVMKKKEWYEKFRWFITKNGLMVIGGRDATTNEIIIKKYMEKNDIVFHSEYYGSPFVLLKNGRENALEEDIIETAIFAASFSRAWKDKILVLDVYYVYPEQVSKKAPSGEYLKKGAFMIYGKKNYLRKIPLRLWLGVKKDNKKLFIGPPTAVEEHCFRNLIFEITPGDLEKSEIAKRVIKAIKEKGLIEMVDELEEYYHNLVVSYLPPGESSLRIITN